ncbi:MAG: GDSL-like Lipase/Acylhydrolase [Planctomycetes bacterium ADurb.Bin401]|nr:MAG: GDSL-like Lipase/Acylhydrolase [Planctomycetes bacterium ADurb.Bin401]
MAEISVKKFSLGVSITLLAVFTTSCLSNYELSEPDKKLHKESLKVKSPERWKANMRKFIALDANDPPALNEILFVGSSSIVGWDTQKWFSDMKTINRGFGGSYISDSVYYADLIILPYKPRVIVFYAGDNDIADNKSPQMLLADFKALVQVIRKELPETRIIVVSTKPSIDRWKFWPKMRESNNLIKEYCDTQKEIYFVDVSKVMLDETGYPRKELFKDDGLHINEKGYELWTSLVKPLIEK